jgi:hypothetical protein
MLVSQSRTPNSIATAVGFETSTNSPVPRLRAEIRIPKLEGSYDIFHYVAHDMKVVVEIIPKPSQPPQTPPAPQRSQQLEREVIRWEAVIGAGLIATCVVIATATFVEDLITAGAGTVDDPATLQPWRWPQPPSCADSTYCACQH